MDIKVDVKMDIKDAVKLTILVGENMLSSGAETYRVEDTMLRILQSCDAQDAHSLCTSTSVFASALDDEGKPITMLRRVKRRSNNIHKIAMVNELSRGFVDGKLDIQQAMAALKKADATPPHPIILRLFGSAVASLCFAIMLGGQFLDSANAFISAFLMQIPVLMLERYNVAGVLSNITGGAFAALFALILMNVGLGVTIDYVIIGSIMPLVPGVSLTNAIRDILEGDLISGSARILDAFLVAIGIAAGVGTVLTLWFFAFGGVFL